MRIRAAKTLAGAIAAAALTLTALSAPAYGAFSITSFAVSPDTPPAGSHPDSTVAMDFGGDEQVKDIVQHFPAGIIPNPEALAKCTSAELQTNTCPSDSRLGTTHVTATVTPPIGPSSTSSGTVYNLQVDPPYVGGLGFVVNIAPPLPAGTLSLEAPFTVRTAQRDITSSFPDQGSDLTVQPIPPTARDNGLTGVSLNVSNTFQGLPLQVTHIDYTLNGMVGTPPQPYITTTTACLSAYPMLEATSYTAPATRQQRLGNVLASTDCDPIPFAPSIGNTLETTQTDTPSGYGISLDFPTGEVPLHQSHLRRTVVKLPPGTAISPSAAVGLEACQDAQLGVGTNNPPTCPAASDIGDVTVESANVPAPLQGNVYLGEPTSSDRFRLFVAFPIVDGVWVKLRGKTVPDPSTGQLTTTFDDLPMLPFTKFLLSLRGGDRAVLVNPAGCGQQTTDSSLTPWKSAPVFAPAGDTHPQATFSTSFNGQGAACPSPRPFDPAGTAATDPTQALASSRLSMMLTVPDRHKLLKSLTVSLPPGLVGRLTGMPLCELAQAAAGSCGEEARIASLTASVGAGPGPLPLPGSIYLAKPLQSGDPASLSIVVPARAGPFDFGSVVLRARVVLRSDGGLDVALVDPLPPLIEGVPIRLRSVAATIDRPGLMRNPTSCAPLEFKATFTSTEGTERVSAAPYEATGCERLGFSPKLRLIANGETKQGGHASLHAIVTQPDGQANIARSTVVLPDVLRPDTVSLNQPGALCQAAQLATRTCPASSRVGTATASTPLLPTTLSGPVYIVQFPASPLPRLAVFLDGAASIRLDARNELRGVRTVNVFDAVPDVAVSRFELTINGGKNGILRNFADLCRKRSRADVEFKSHSGKAVSEHPALEVPACGVAPKVSASLRGVRSGTPTVQVRVRRSAGGAKLERVDVALPRSLRVSGGRSARGVGVKAARLLKRSAWKLSRSGSLKVRKLGRRGARSVTLTLRAGVLRSSPALQSELRAHKRPRLPFTIRATDVKRHRFTMKLQVRPRS